MLGHRSGVQRKASQKSPEMLRNAGSTRGKGKVHGPGLVREIKKRIWPDQHTLQLSLPLSFFTALRKVVKR